VIAHRLSLGCYNLIQGPLIKTLKAYKKRNASKTLQHFYPCSTFASKAGVEQRLLSSLTRSVDLGWSRSVGTRRNVQLAKRQPPKRQPEQNDRKVWVDFWRVDHLS